MQVVVMCGGSGTRLWPLSRQTHPKQFIELLEGKSLLGQTLKRLSPLAEEGGLTCVGSEDHRFLLAEELRQAGVKAANIILEPCPKNTASAMALAVLSADPSDNLLFVPADHYIPDHASFLSCIREGHSSLKSGQIMLFGIRPTEPATGFGYIEVDDLESGSKRREEIIQSAQSDQSLHIKRFVEKPSKDLAEQMLSQGGFFWNAGIFLGRAQDFLSAMRKHMNDILLGCEAAMQNKHSECFEGFTFQRPETEAFQQIRPESIDYALMEKHGHLRLMPYLGAWNDVGSWAAASQLLPVDSHGNAHWGDAIFHDSQNTTIFSTDRLVAAVGLSGVVVVDTPDALLVMEKSQSESVKNLVHEIESKGLKTHVSHRKVYRPWGWYDSVVQGDRFQVKRILVRPGASLSLQLHNHRAEHWIVVKGTAKVTRDQETFVLAENESTYIPIAVKHRLENPGKIDLEIIEIQSGGYLGEDDIVRFEDTYGRAP